MGTRGTTFFENAESDSIISMTYKREAHFTVQLGPKPRLRPAAKQIFAFAR
jgi:hypothetical protein